MKVRAWHNKAKRFLGKEEYCLDLDGKLIFVDMKPWAKEGDPVNLVAVPPELYQIQHWTGLKDKNGKEIYEGDLVRFRWERREHRWEEEKGKVHFEEGIFYFGDMFAANDVNFDLDSLEVIGNVNQGEF